MTVTQRTDERVKTERPSPPEPRTWHGLSIPGLLAGAGASVTAAVLGSHLGVGGTLGGAAVSSVVATAAGALYTAGLQRTHEGLRVVVRRRRPTADETLPQGDPGDELSVDPALGLARERVVTGRRGLAAAGWLVAAVATFGLALAVITGIEANTGKTLSGETGTSVGRVAVRSEPTASVAPTPTATPTAPSTPTASATPSPTASATPSVQATPTASASAATPTASVTATATATQSASSAPTTPQSAGN